MTGRQPLVARMAGWLWGLGAVLSVVLVLTGAYVGRHLVMAHRQAAAFVDPPAIAPILVMRTLRPGAGAAFAIPLGTSTRMVLVSGSVERTCPPVGQCGAMPPLDRIQVVDVSTGATEATRALDGPARQPLAVVTDDARGLVALISAHAIATYAAAALNPVAVLPLPDGVATDQSAGAVIGPNGTVWLTARQQGHLALLGIDERSGQMRVDVSLSAAEAVDGPIFDAHTGAMLVLARAGGAAQLLAFDATKGVAVRQIALAPGARLGALDPATGDVYCFAQDGTTFRLAQGHGGEVPSPVTIPALFGARALGWDLGGGYVYVADAVGVRVLDAQTGATMAALPLVVQSPPGQALLPVAAGGERDLPLLAEHGVLVVVRAVPAGTPVMTADTAVALARAALTRLVPQDVGNPRPQIPRFLTADVFPVGPGLRETVPFMVRDPDVGWQSATPGTAEVEVVAADGGAYDVTFTVTWTQHNFTHRHIAVLRVTPAGGVALRSDSGDGLP